MKYLSLSLVLAGLALGCAGEIEPDGPGGSSSTNGGGGSVPTDGGSGGVGGSVSDGGMGGASAGCAQDCSEIETPACFIATCNEDTGSCEIGPEDDDAPCDDGLYCSVNDSCQAGVCEAGPPLVCKGSEDVCLLLVCDEGLDTCTGGPVPNGSACTSPNVCEVNAICVNGTCAGGPIDCSLTPVDDCLAAACNPANGICEGGPDMSQNGAACEVGGDPCMVAKTCNAGLCDGGSPKDCSALDIGCQNGVCEPASGICTPTAVPIGGQCNTGSDQCNFGTCNASQNCVGTPLPNGTVCDDFSTCSSGDTCTAGACGGAIDPLCTTYFEDNFENGCPPAGWQLSGEWQCGPPTVVGPPAAFEGANVIGTIINGNYSNSQTFEVDFAQTPPIGLGGTAVPTLTYRHWVDTEGSVYDGYNVKISTDGGNTWSVVTTVDPPYNLTVAGQPVWGGHQQALGWQAVSANLTAFAGQQVLVRFSFRSDGSVIYPGVYIDDVAVAEGTLAPVVITTASLPEATLPNSYSTTVQRTGGSANAVWSITAGTNDGWLSINSGTGLLSGTPTLANVGPVSVTIHLEEPLDPTNFDDATFTFNVQDTVYANNFETTCPNGWVLTGEWQCGTPTSGPNSALSGIQLIATNLAGNYTNNQTFAGDTATSPVVDLSGTAAPTLRFWVWYLTESCCDGFNVRASSDGVSYTLLPSISPAYNQTLAGEQCWSGTSPGWVQHEVDLSAFGGQQVNLRFAFRSDLSVVNPGVYIDDLTILD